MSDESRQGYRFPGDVEIQSINLITSSGVSIDIAGLITELNIYQDISEHYVQCELVCEDATGFYQLVNGDTEKQLSGGFTGGDLLTVSFRNRSTDFEFKRFMFVLYSQTNKVRRTENLESYILNGISIEAYTSAGQKISRSYGGKGGNTIDNMLKSIYNEFLYNNDIKTIYEEVNKSLSFPLRKTAEFDTTNGLQRFVIPNFTVDDAIEFLVSEADNDEHVPLFFFYENSEGYKFKDINNLVNEPIKETYTYRPLNYHTDGSSVNDPWQDPLNIVTYDVDRQTDILLNARAGLFKSRTINVDILKKQKKEVIFQYEDNYKKFNKLQRFGIPGQVQGDSNVLMITSRTGHDVCCPIFAPENHLPKRVNQFAAAKKSYQRHIFNTVVNVTVYGNSDLQVGDVVYLKIPIATSINDLANKEDKYLSGKYLITRLRHKLPHKTGDGFYTIFTCVKDTATRISED